MPWFLVSPRYWHPWYCLFKVGVNWFMRRSILIVLAISSLKSDRKCTCICALQNEIDTHKLELYNNNRFILTIGIFKMNKLRLHIPKFLYISWKVYTIFQCTEITQGDKMLFMIIRDLHISHFECHGCWWPSDTRNQVIKNHTINGVELFGTGHAYLS